jgi:hypothetical protein
MVLVTERPEPPHPQETKEASANGLGSLDPEPAGSPGVRIAIGSQFPGASPAPEPQGGTNSAAAPQHPEAFPDLKSHMPSWSEPMEVDELDP